MLRMLLMILAHITILASYTLVILPLVTPFDRRDKCFNRLFWWWASAWLWTCGARVRFEGAPRLEALAGRPFVLVGNHQSALDIALLIVLCRGRLVFTGIRLFGLIRKNFAVNWSPRPIFTGFNSYSRAHSSSMMLIFFPFGVGQ